MSVRTAGRNAEEMPVLRAGNELYDEEEFLHQTAMLVLRVARGVLQTCAQSAGTVHVSTTWQ